MEGKDSDPAPSSDVRNADDLQAERDNNPLFASTSVENMPVKENRVFKKAKRSLKVNSKHDDDASMSARDGLPMARSPTSPSGAHFKPGTLPFSKNSRRSRNVLAHSRGQPKKGRNFVIVIC